MNIRNKIGLLGVCVCLIGAFTSCSNDDSDIDPYGRKKRGNVYLSLQMDTDFTLSTRATDIEYGSKEERAITSVYALFYEVAGENSKLLYNIPISATTDGENNITGADVYSGGQNSFVSTPISLKKQDYQMIILVNATSSLLSSVAKSEEDDPTGYNTLKDIQAAITATSAETFYQNNTNFFMSNARGIIYVPESDLKNKDSEATSNPTHIPVERLVAKVSVHKGFDDNEVTFGGKIGEVTWGIDIQNRQTYLLRQADRLLTGGQETGFHTERNEVYAKDPNFDINAEFLIDEAKKNDHFTMLTLAQSDGYQNWNSPASSTTYYQYLLENTMSKEDQNNDKTDPKAYTSQILLKVIITEPKGMQGVDDYYSFEDSTETDLDKKWKVFTHAQAVEWYNNTFPIDMVALKDILKEAQEVTDAPFNFEEGTEKEPTEYVTTSFNKLTYHKDGLNVYRIPIMHFGVDDRITSEEDYGYYGVVRNNIYKIVIKSIKGPGIDSSNEGYISTDITINPWYGREWGEDVKPGE